jgi:hypothetical protein
MSDWKQFQKRSVPSTKKLSTSGGKADKGVVLVARVCIYSAWLFIPGLDDIT